MNSSAKVIVLILSLTIFYNCENDDVQNLDYSNLEPITIGDYAFKVPAQFNLIEEQGIDSYVGRLEGESIKMTFDFGYYSGGPDGYVPDNTYEILTDTINGHIREIYRALDSQRDRTSINYYAINGYSENINSFLALSMGARGLSAEEQDLVILIFKSGVPID